MYIYLYVSRLLNDDDDDDDYDEHERKKLIPTCRTDNLPSLTLINIDYVFFSFFQRILVMWRWWWLSSYCATHLVAFFLCLAIYKCGCQLEFTTSILEWGYILLSSFCVLSLSLFYSLLMSLVFFYICRPVDKRRSKRKRWTLLVSHISLYPSFIIVVHFYSQSMLPHISSSVVIVYLFFVCPR
jgi:hypothetical protein